VLAAIAMLILRRLDLPRPSLEEQHGSMRPLSAIVRQPVFIVAATVAALGYAVVECAAQDDIAPLVPWLAHQRTVLVGQSGMGKSTIINALAPAADVRVGDVSRSLHAGRHTTSATTLYRTPALGDDGWIVDSPGMKAFGLAHVSPAALEQAFVELRPLLGHCRFRDCHHDREPGCAVNAAVDDGRVAPFRLALLHTLQRESSVR